MLSGAAEKLKALQKMKIIDIGMAMIKTVLPTEIMTIRDQDRAVN